MTELPQTYQRRGPNAFWYRAPSVGYEGLLELAPNGFIRNYPNLWWPMRPSNDRVGRLPRRSPSANLPVMAPQALVDLLHGGNFGKMLVKLI